MDAHIVEFSVKAFLTQLREGVEQAEGLAAAADECARVGQVARGVELAGDLDELVHEATQLLGMATTLVRSPATSDAGDHAGGRTSGSEPASSASTDPSMTSETIQAFLHRARQRLHRAVGIARAAELLATTGNTSDGTRVALDVEPLLHEASRLVDAASLLNRMSKEATAPN